MASAVVAALAACSRDGGDPAAAPSPASTRPGSPGSSASVTTPSVTGTARRFDTPSGMPRVAVPAGTLYHLPGFDPTVTTGGRMAFTVDDGTDPMVVGAYAALCRDTGLRVTFFLNGVNPSWTEHAPALRSLHDAGQIFLANHTWSHQDLTRLTSSQLSDQVRRNEQFLSSTFGTLGRPFLRPPFGYRNPAVVAQLADLGYPAVTMWEGSIGDATAVKIPKLLGLAREWFRPGRIVIGHANHPGVTTVYDQLVELIHGRGIQPVHLGDVFQV